jgi:alkylation response protein AidB-like acyl-CoA dehydrogenase
MPLTAPEAVDRARELSARFALTAAEADRAARLPEENFRQLKDAGLLALTCRVEWGGDGLGVAAACRVVEEIARGEPSTALILAMQYIHHGAPAVHRRWPVTTHERLTREAVEQGALVNVIRAEPELGTPSRGGLPGATATRKEGGWNLSGHKLYATGSQVLAYYLVAARTDDEQPREGSFAVPAKAVGVRLIETWDHLGMRATGSHDLVLEDVQLAEEMALELRPPGPILTDTATGPYNNLVIAAVYNGVARAARDWLVRYLNERKPTNLGASLATLPRHQMAVGEIEGLLYTNERLIHGLAAEVEAEGYPQRGVVASALSKSIAASNAISVVEQALKLVGNPGLTRHNPLERHHRDVLCSRIHVPQDDMVQLMVGKAALGVR